MKITRLTSLLLLATYCSFAQVGIGNTNPQAILDISASNTTSPANADGILIPRMSNFPSNPGATRDGLLIFYTGTAASGKGFYYWDQGTTSWVQVTGAKSINNLTDGKTDTNEFSIYLGKDSGINDDDTANSNTGLGYQALRDNTSGSLNTAIGWGSLSSNTSGSNNIAIGHLSMTENETGGGNIGIGRGVNHLTVNTSNNTIVGNFALFNNSNGSNNTVLGYEAGNVSDGSGNIFLGHRAAASIGSSVDNKLVIENTDADENNALIYGDFGNDNSATGNILRTNSEFQIGNPTTTGYAFPTIDGTNGQVMTTDGSGNVTFLDLPTITDTDEQDLSSNVVTANEEVEITITSGTNTTINIQDADADVNNEVITSAILNGTNLELTEAGSTTTINLSALLDNDWTEVTGGDIERQSGDVYIGNTATTNNDLYISGSIIDWDNTTYNLDLTGFNKLSILELDGGSSASPGLAIGDNNTGFYSNSVGTLTHTGNGVSTFNIFSDGEINFRGFNSNYDFTSSSFYNNAGISLGTINSSIPLLYGYIDNDANEIVSEFEILSNNINFSHTALRTFSDIGDNEVRLSYNSNSTNRYAVYAVSPNDFAGYFRGIVEFGTSTTNRYNMPTADGSAGQIMTTDGTGNLSFQNPTVNTDNQQIDNLGLSGTVLGISLEDDGVGPATVDLSSINTDDQQIDNFNFNSSTNELTLEIEDDGQVAQTVDLSSLNPTKAMARITMNADQTETGSGTTKVNFDARDFDIGNHFNLINDNYVIPTTGVYRVTAQITMSASTGIGNYAIRIRVNNIQQRRSECNHHGNGPVLRQVTSILSLTAGDTIDVSFVRPVVGATVESDTRESFFEIEQL